MVVTSKIDNCTSIYNHNFLKKLFIGVNNAKRIDRTKKPTN